MNLDPSICNFAGDVTLHACNKKIDILITEVESTLGGYSIITSRLGGE